MSPHPYGWLSLLPPIVAIVLAMITRRIVFSLVVGIFAGSLLMAGGDPLLAMYHTWETHLWRTLIDPDKLRVFSFTLLMGAMIGVITRSGGMKGLIELVSPYASNRRRGQFATWVMGLLIFFDDYANTILLGSTLRPICDRLRISREKLAYLVDSTAAPVAGLAPLSTWVAVEIDYIANGLDGVTGATDGMSAFSLFLASIPYRFYIWCALLLVPITIWLRRDIGPMVKAEERAIDGQTREELSDRTSEESQAKSSWYNAVLPIALTLGLVVYFIYSTGSAGACRNAAESSVSSARAILDSDAQPSTELESVYELVFEAAETANVSATSAAIDDLILQLEALSLPNSTSEEIRAALTPKLGMRYILGEANSSLALQYGALAGLCLAVLLPVIARLLPVDQLVAGAASGARVVLPAVAILWTASAMSNMTRDTSVDGDASEVAYQFKDHRLYTADYLTKQFVGPVADVQSAPFAEPNPRLTLTKWFPTLVFVLAAIVAFCTGTSWGTMGILVPMVVQTSFALLIGEGKSVLPSDPILLSSIGGVLAGAVFGDHCSPISDTTVLSSQSSGCGHLEHVWTQMPYAVLAAGVSIFLGTLPIGFGWSVWLMLPLQLAALILLMRVMGKRPVGETLSG